MENIPENIPVRKKKKTDIKALIKMLDVQMENTFPKQLVD